MKTSSYSSEETASELSAVPVLTVLYHPDLGRVGERAILADLLAGRAVPLSRDAPGFAPVGRAAEAPLADSCVSRTPLLLELSPGGGVRVRRGECRTRLEHRGAAVTGDLELQAADLQRGAVLRVGGKIVLLLHHVRPDTGQAHDAGDFVGESDGIQRVRREIVRVADMDVPVLVRGETGTGKELVARAVHRASARRDGPFVAVNLGAVAPELAMSELFGAERGSFTGAVKEHDGYFGAAREGTLFLDEIGEASAPLQAMLLRALESGEIQRVGASRPRRIDVRVVAATDAPLEARIREGSFRAPLFHRLSASQIWIPPLRARRDDIGRLLLHFLRAELERVGEPGRLAPAEKPWLPPSLVARLGELDWPGNVRQLQNAARQLVISGRGRERIELGSAIERVIGHVVEPGAPRTAPPLTITKRKPAEVTHDELLAALRASRWELAAAAELLRISRASIYVLVERSGTIQTAGDLTVDEITRAHRECKGDIPRMVDRLEVSEKALRRRLHELGLAPR